MSATRRDQKADNGPVTWDGVQVMISKGIEIYDEKYIIPRENFAHSKLREEHKEIRDVVADIRTDLDEVLKTIHQWHWPVKIIIGMLGLILMGVAAQVADLVRWGVVNGWHYK